MMWVSRTCWGKAKLPRKERLEINKARLPVQALKHYMQHVRKKEVAARLQTPPRLLNPEQQRAILEKVFPAESTPVTQQRKKVHKWLWRNMKTKNWDRFESTYAQLEIKGIPFDEITYNLGMYGNIVSKRQKDEDAIALLEKMKQDKLFHPSLIRLHEGFLTSYFELKALDATPKPLNVLKSMKTFWEVSLHFKRLRMHELRVGIRAWYADKIDQERKEELQATWIRSMGEPMPALEASAQVLEEEDVTAADMLWMHKNDDKEYAIDDDGDSDVDSDEEDSGERE